MIEGKYQIWHLGAGPGGGDRLVDAVDHRSYLFQRAEAYCARVGPVRGVQPRIEYRNRDTGRKLQSDE